MKIIFILLAFGLSALSATTKREARKQPNILLLLADDMGFGELGCEGQCTTTPFI